jgi:hypothetical protein
VVASLHRMMMCPSTDTRPVQVGEGAFGWLDINCMCVLCCDVDLHMGWVDWGASMCTRTGSDSHTSLAGRKYRAHTACA